MVLTNFECWAHGGGDGGEMPFGYIATRQVDPFYPPAVQQLHQRAQEEQQSSSTLSHISSNGYYGFSYVNAAHELDENGGNNNSNNNNNIATHNHNCNGNGRDGRDGNDCMEQGNDVNGVMTQTLRGAAAAAAAELPNGAIGCRGVNGVNGGGGGNVIRCKKRFFVGEDDYADFGRGGGGGGGVGGGITNTLHMVGAAKRCRFDDDFAAQYCNDFFSLPTTQIGTQSCLMDTEDHHDHHQNNHHQQQHPHHPQHQHQLQQQQQQQVDDAMESNHPSPDHNFINHSTRNTTTSQTTPPPTATIDSNDQRRRGTILNTLDTPTTTMNNDHHHHHHHLHGHVNQNHHNMQNSTNQFVNMPSNQCEVTFNKSKQHQYKQQSIGLEEQNFSTITGRSFSPISQIVPSQAQAQIQADDGMAYMFATTHGGSIYQFAASSAASPLASAATRTTNGNEHFSEDI